MPANKIAFQGEFGANSDIACRNVYPDMQPLPSATFEDALSRVESGEAGLAMIPIENTLAGRVADIHHLLPRTKLSIIGEYFLPIHFQLMVKPGTTFAQIQSVYSHIHALGQCRNIIRQNGWKAVIASDTAGAARFIKDHGDNTMAALAPTLASQLYGLDILKTNVEDEANNITRFIILAPKPSQIAPSAKENTITTFIFRVRNVPSALYKALGGFSTNGINMTKLESYQLGGSFKATQFLADIEGHPENPMVKLAFEELNFFSKEVNILGVYPASPERDRHDFG